jgi:hypothetical protein
MPSRMKERKGVANRVASSPAEAVARLPSKRRQRYQWAGYGVAKTARGAHVETLLVAM